MVYQIPGIEYYNELIDALLAANITPVVTMNHWDTPQALEDVGGWTNDSIVDVIVDYARILFDNFGDRVSIAMLILFLLQRNFGVTMFSA